jgi:hypothetical protein
VNALSHLVITMDAYNATDEATLAELLAFINNVQVTKSGVGVIDLQSEDLYALNAYLFRGLPTLTGRLATDNYTRSVTLVVPFGRRILDAGECFPPTKKGELTLRVDTTVPATSADNSTITIEAVEIVDANPQGFLRAQRKAISAPGATGWNHVDLPIGNRIVCLQLRCTTIPTTSSHTFGVEHAKVLVENQEYGYASADGMCLAGERALRVGCPDTTIAAQGLSPLNNIMWLDFDPRGDGEFLLETAGKSSLQLGLDMGVDEATQLSVVELVGV